MCITLAVLVTKREYCYNKVKTTGCLISWVIGRHKWLRLLSGKLEEQGLRELLDGLRYLKGKIENEVFEIPRCRNNNQDN